MLASSSGSNYSTGLSPASNNIVDISNAPDHNRAPENSLVNVRQSAEILPPSQGSVNNGAQQNLEHGNAVSTGDQQGLIV